jgi:hypothetical protein
MSGIENSLTPVKFLTILLACLFSMNINAREKGTSDSGGGTGFNGLVMESYLVDIEQLPGFQQVVLPIFQNIQSDGQASSEDKIKSLKSLTRSKSWYLIPGPIQNVNVESLGVSFSGVDLIAVQRHREIWIDREKFNLMSTKQQGEILLHEIIMQVYFWKFYTFKELCEVGFTSTSKSSTSLTCEQITESMNSLMPPVPRAPLTDEDNMNIRSATGWLLLEGHRSISSDEFIQVLFRYGFDPRFFGNKTADQSQNSTFTLSRQDFMKELSASKISGYWPQNCKDIQNKKMVPCQVDIVLDRMSFQTLQNQHQLSMPVIKLDIDSNQEKQTIFFYLNENIALTRINSFYIAPAVVPVNQDTLIGDSTYYGVFIFKLGGTKEKKEFELQSIILRREIIVKLEPTEYTIKCESRVPRYQNVFDVGMLLKVENSDPHLSAVEGFLIENSEFRTCKW